MYQFARKHDHLATPVLIYWQGIGTDLAQDRGVFEFETTVPLSASIWIHRQFFFEIVGYLHPDHETEITIMIMRWIVFMPLLEVGPNAV